MNKRVRIIIEGRQAGDESQSVDVKAEGTCQYLNGKHYIRFEEESEPSGPMIKNMIKLSAEQILINKEGAGISTHMVFDVKEATRATYITPYGGLDFKISSTSIVMMEVEKEIRAIIRYILSDQTGQLSENQVNIRIVSI